jgi:hypothetical protein
MCFLIITNYLLEHMIEKMVSAIIGKINNLPIILPMYNLYCEIYYEKTDQKINEI